MPFYLNALFLLWRHNCSTQYRSEMLASCLFDIILLRYHGASSNDAQGAEKDNPQLDVALVDALTAAACSTFFALPSPADWSLEDWCNEVRHPTE